jgi:cyclopropane fatty-acyl-phospholipid synthase-like methyltransferase
LRGLIYDAAILPLTARWYAEVLGRLPRGAHLLDVGIGTGGALARNASTVRDRDLKVVGVDIDRAYVERCKRRMRAAGLEGRVEVRLESVTDHVGLQPYDAVYFSASFMLMPDPPGVLRHVTSLLAPGGRLFFTQTFQDRRSVVMERAKPLLKKLTTIEFGRVTYEAEFRSALAEGGVALRELETIGRSGARSYRIAVAVPEATSSAVQPTRS